MDHVKQPQGSSGKQASPGTRDLKPGDHLCCLYETEQEHRAVLTAFLRQGLERGEKVIYVVDAHPAEAILGYLGGGGDVEPYLGSGQLTILTSDDAYMRRGGFDPQATIAFLRAETEQALARGYPALRVTGEMTWALRGLPGSGRLIEYEARLNEFFPDSNCLAICQYDRRRFAPEVLLDVLRTHPAAVVGAQVYDNLYYLPPAGPLGVDRGAAELQGWLHNLAAQKQAEEELHDLVEIMRFTESVSAKVHDALHEAEVCRVVKEEFAKSRRYTASILLLTADGAKLRIAETSLPPGKLKEGERAAGLRMGEYTIDLNRSSTCGQVVREGKTLQASVSDVIGELFPRPLAGLISKTMGYEGNSSILTPLERRGKITGVLAISSTARAEHFVPSATALARHISAALELASERDERKRAEQALRRSSERLRRTLEATVDALAAAIEMRDPYTAGHQRRVTRLACAIAEEMGLPEEQVEGIRMAGLIHDVGKIAVPAEILSRPGPLGDLELRAIQDHPRVGYRVLKGIEFPWPVADGLWPKSCSSTTRGWMVPVIPGGYRVRGSSWKPGSWVWLT